MLTYVFHINSCVQLVAVSFWVKYEGVSVFLIQRGPNRPPAATIDVYVVFCDTIQHVQSAYALIIVLPSSLCLWICTI